MKNKKFVFCLFPCLLFMLIGLWSASARPIPKAAGKYDENDPHHFIMADINTEYLSNLNDVFIDNNGNKINDIWSVTLPGNLKEIGMATTTLNQEGFYTILGARNYSSKADMKSSHFLPDLEDLPQFYINVTMPNVKFTEIYNLCVICRCNNTIINISENTNIDFTGILRNETPYSGGLCDYRNIPYIPCIKFNVSFSNPYFSSSPSGVLFNKNKTVLYKFPANIKGVYKVPTSVKVIGECAFAGCTLNKLYITEDVEYINPNAFVYAYGGAKVPIWGKCYFPPKYSINEANSFLQNCSGSINEKIGLCTQDVYHQAKTNLHMGNDPVVEDILYNSENSGQDEKGISNVYRVINNSNSTSLIYQFNYTDGDGLSRINDMFQTGTIKDLSKENFDSKVKNTYNPIKDIPPFPNYISILHIQDPSIKIYKDMDLHPSSKKWPCLKSIYVDFKSESDKDQNLTNINNIASSLPSNVKKLGLMLDRPIKYIEGLKDLTYNSLQRYFPVQNIALDIRWVDQFPLTRKNIYIDENNKNTLNKKYFCQLSMIPFGMI